MVLDNLPTNDEILASTARYLIDGDQCDAATVLLACALSVDDFKPNIAEGPTAVVTLRGPRSVYGDFVAAAGYNSDREEFLEFGPPEPREPDAKHEYSLELMSQIESALLAILPPPIKCVEVEYRVQLVELDKNWRDELRQIARGTPIHNQAIGADRVITWKNHRFRSHTEVRVAKALDDAKALFFPNCKARLGVSQRINKEPDFLVFHKGTWGILEVDGPHHTSAAVDHERDRLFKHHGINLIEHFDAGECFENAVGVVKKFLYLLERA